jgi:cytidylate kinase
MKTKIITITGDLGSGKSTVSGLLCKTLNYDYVYTGKIQREIAGRYNMTTLELNKYSETHPEVDEAIDSNFKSLGSANNLVVDSRMAWFFIPHSFKVFLKAEVEVAVERISADNQRKNEKYASREEAVKNIIARKASENRRYLALYGADSSNASNFDLVIDTSRITPEQAAERLIRGYESWLKHT